MSQQQQQQQLEKAENAVATSQRAKVVPNVDIFEGTDETWVVADLPGVSREALHVEIENDELRFHADAANFDDDGAAFQYARAFRIPLGIDPQKVAADLKDGVLTLKLPKPSEMKPRKIDVKIA